MMINWLFALISCTVISIIVAIAIYIIYKGNNDFEGKFLEWIFFSFIFCAVINMIGISYAYHMPVMDKYSYSYNIYALEDSTSINGSGYRYSFFIQENNVYKVITDYRGGKRTINIPSNYAYIIESDKVEPHVEVYSKVPKNQNFITIHFFVYNDESQRYTYKMYTPKKTITNKFNVDLNK